MPWILLEDHNDERLAPYREITHGRSSQFGDLLIAEGWWMVQRLLESRFEIHSLVVATNRMEIMRERVGDDHPVYMLEQDRMQELLGYNFHRGIVACGRRDRLTRFVPSPEAVAKTGEAPGEGVAGSRVRARRILIACPRIIDPTNLGGIVRAACAFGAEAVLCGEEGADPFSRRVIRVSAGNVFRLPVIEPSDLYEELARLQREQDFEVVATTLQSERTTSLYEYASMRDVVLLLGAEDFGLEESWLQLSTTQLNIPMQNETDSLNVAASASVCLYALRALEQGHRSV